MATNFDLNSISSTGGFIPSTLDTPLDMRSRVETESDIYSIPKPFLGLIVYVKDTGKIFVITGLKDKKVGMFINKNALVDTYREIDVGDLSEYATQSFVTDKIAELQLDLNNYATKDDLVNYAQLSDLTDYVTYTQLENYQYADISYVDNQIATHEHPTITEADADEIINNIYK